MQALYAEQILPRGSKMYFCSWGARTKKA